MRINPNYKLREMAGEVIIVNLVGAYHIDAGQALRDAGVWVEKLVQCRVIDRE